MLKIESRPYYCPVCGNKETHSTNHIGEIYTHCKACGNSPLYCELAAEEYTQPPDKTAILHVYKFNLETQRDEYKALCQRLSEMGYARAEALDPGYGRPAGHKFLFAMGAWDQHDGETVRIYRPEQFQDQYVSNLGRVHTWYETIYPNAKIKHGYWLEFTA